MDWSAQGATTPVYDQGQCGSCWAFSATEQIESMSFLQKKVSTIQKLSQQQIVDCDTTAQGCNG
jgi:C1A family cysteine protease